MGLDKKDLIELCINTDDEFKKILEMEKDLIKDRTNAKNIEIVNFENKNIKDTFDFKIKDKTGQIEIVIK